MRFGPSAHFGLEVPTVNNYVHSTPLPPSATRRTAAMLKRGAWSVGTVSRQSLLRKWVSGPLLIIAPLVTPVFLALSLGTFVGTRSLIDNPDLAIAKARRGIDVTEARTNVVESKAGAQYQAHGFRGWLRARFFTGFKGTLESRPTGMSTDYLHSKA